MGSGGGEQLLFEVRHKEGEKEEGRKGGRNWEGRREGSRQVHTLASSLTSLNIFFC